jgi:hypothetical protein
VIAMPLAEYFWRRQARNGRAVIICVIILGIRFPIGFSSQNGLPAICLAASRPRPNNECRKAQTSFQHPNVYLLKSRTRMSLSWGLSRCRRILGHFFAALTYSNSVLPTQLM